MVDHYTKLVVRPQAEFGIDWSRPRTVLARRGTLELWWQGPGSVWSGVGIPHEYVPTELITYDVKLKAWPDPPSDSRSTGTPRRAAASERASNALHEGGRLSRRLLVEHAVAIDTFFGVAGVEPLIDLNKDRRTLVLK